MKNMQYMCGNKKAWVGGLVLLSLCISVTGIVDEQSKKNIEAIFMQAVSAYGIGRIVNGTIALLQSIELSIPVIGGAAISPLQVLTPWNELIDRFSLLMEVAIGSLVVQRLLIELVATPVFQMVFIFSGVMFVVSLYRPGMYGRAGWFKSYLGLLFARYSVVFVVMLNGIVNQEFLQEKTDSDLAGMTHISQSLDALGSSPEEIEKKQQEQQSFSGIRDSKMRWEEKRTELQRSLQEMQKPLAVAEDNMHIAHDKLSFLEKLHVGEPSEEMVQARKVWEEKNAAYLIQEDALQRAETAITTLERQMQDAYKGGRSNPVDLMKAVASGGKDLLQGAMLKMNAYVDTVLRLMAIFFLQTLLLPLLFFWWARRMLQFLWRMDIPTLTR